jgi:hypothetical protein
MNRRIVAAALVALTLAACGGRGRMDEGTNTGVVLSHNNYRVLKAGATGTSTGFWFLFIPIVTRSYAAAQADLYRSVKEPLEGRSVALANKTEDTSLFTLLLFSLPRLTITADVVEFTDSPTATPRQPPLEQHGSSVAPDASRGCSMIGNTLRCDDDPR